MKAEIICIGTELLLGEIVDTNASYLSQVLAGLGIDLYYKLTVGDNLERAIATLKQAWERSDLLLLSGGLGPTQDDLTREAIAGMLGEEQVLNEAAMTEVAAWFRKSGREMPGNNRRQAMFPTSAEPITNRWGTAPGVWVEKDGKILAAMPGVPLELHKLMEEEIIPRLKRHLGTNHPILVSRTLRAIGIGESALEERIEDLINTQSDVTIAPYAKRGEVHLRLAVKAITTEEGSRKIEPVEAAVRKRLDGYIFGCNSSGSRRLRRTESTTGT
ncbi:MAG TPA: CinA family nicotinamide mononucleotide deamidase-related protein [Bacillota bacterium]|nr:CinA family nicotinamide mononucleotide deamidase-related protein [Bacillota bacterium]